MAQYLAVVQKPATSVAPSDDAREQRVIMYDVEAAYGPRNAAV